MSGGRGQLMEAGEAKVRALEKDAERYRFLSRTLTLAKAGGGVEVNEERQLYQDPEPGKEVRVYWYPRTPVGHCATFGSTLDEAVDKAIKESKDHPDWAGI